MKYLRVAMVLVLILGMAGGVSAKVYDSFEDGDYTNDPSWSEYSNPSASVTNSSAADGSYSVVSNSDGVLYSPYSFQFRGAKTYRSWIKTDTGPSYDNGDYFENYFGLTDSTSWWGDNMLMGGIHENNEFRLQVRNGGSVNQVYLSNAPYNEWVRVDITVYPSKSEANVSFYNSDGDYLNHNYFTQDVPDDSSLEYYAFRTYGTDTDTKRYYDFVRKSPFNKGPQFNSTNIDPDPPLIGENVNYSAETYDSGGIIQETCLKVDWKGSQVYQSCKASNSPRWSDVYKPGSTGWLNATLNTTNEQGNTTSTEINRLLAKEWNFTTCGSTGRYGPSKSQCDSAYQGTNLKGEVNIVDEGLQEWTVPKDGEYKITAVGAASGENQAGDWRGRGAIMRGDFTLDSGDSLLILVGQRGQGINNGASSGDGAAGGGGTFVTIGNNYATSDPLIIGGGGGGPNNDQSSRLSAADASTSTIAKDSTSESGNLGGGTDGGAGVSGADKYAGNGGSGFVESASRPGSDTGYPGESFRSGGVGGHNRYQDESDTNRPKGGFGAGSAGDVDGAGGGGYTGGGGVANTPWISGSAGGGGSFLHASASDPATSDGDWGTTGSEPHNVYSGSVGDLSKWNSGQGYVEIELITSKAQEFCNYRGPFNQCIMNKTNQLDQDSYNVSSIFEARESAVLEALNRRAEINFFNSSALSGLWRGSFRINADRPIIKSGAKFRPEGGRIVIGR